jgi:hypothetical protein
LINLKIKNPKKLDLILRILMKTEFKNSFTFALQKMRKFIWLCKANKDGSLVPLTSTSTDGSVPPRSDATTPSAPNLQLTSVCPCLPKIGRNGRLIGQSNRLSSVENQRQLRFTDATGADCWERKPVGTGETCQFTG